MYNYGKNKNMQKRPENEPKFSLKNKTDRTIFWIIIIALLVLGALIALIVFLICKRLY